MLALIALSALLLSMLTPPFQSPDEFDHVKRAYLLSRGQILLQSPPGEGSGGAVDTGLLAYMSVFWALPFKPDKKVTTADLAQARSVQWTREHTFSAAPGTGYYLPLAYLPQAMALAVSRYAGLSVDVSYRAARLAALLVAFAMLAWALRLHPLPPVAIGLLTLPMTLFQLASASLDAVTYALAVLALACYLHASRARGATRPRVLITFSVAMFVIITCRFHLFPMVLLFAALWQMTGRRAVLWAGMAVCVLALAWTMVAMQTTVDPRTVTGTSARTVLLHYLANPGTFLALVAHMLALPDYQDFYRQSFLGILGWLDARFDVEQYRWLGWGLAWLVLGSVGPFWRWRGHEIGWRVLLLACSIACVLLIFLALLATWNPHPAQVIEGVQGRYFWVPMLMACLALAPSAETSNRLHRRALVGAQLIFIAFSVYSTAGLLLTRYWAA
ncbi:DUF2142 domain-containing protein [Pseudorhodoferax sp.]|uniref:DUF2142 domain-containing protein n=1 Tax=Pseudorhodoferax sp. TaxID=1993553 RepID=UPI002DD626FC|nr:DUF2142 domain-containing protein [Pseudorhodoferax sp.]